MTDALLLAIFNGCEALLWIGLAGFLFRRYRNAAQPVHRLSRIASVWLFLFGVSDVIEIQTGAWWRPWWLLVLKGVCLTGLFVCAWRGLWTQRNS